MAPSKELLTSDGASLNNLSRIIFINEQSDNDALESCHTSGLSLVRVGEDPVLLPGDRVDDGEAGRDTDLMAFALQLVNDVLDEIFIAY